MRGNFKICHLSTKVIFPTISCVSECLTFVDVVGVCVCVCATLTTVWVQSQSQRGAEH